MHPTASSLSTLISETSLMVIVFALPLLPPFFSPPSLALETLRLSPDPTLLRWCVNSKTSETGAGCFLPGRGGEAAIDSSLFSSLLRGGGSSGRHTYMLLVHAFAFS